MALINRNIEPWCICDKCIMAIRSRGEKILVGDLIYDYDESEAENKPCEWCGEYGDIYETF